VTGTRTWNRMAYRATMGWEEVEEEKKMPAVEGDEEVVECPLDSDRSDDMWLRWASAHNYPVISE
jgi:hypothetical protein